MVSVRLDFSRVPEGRNERYAFLIAEALLEICKVIEARITPEGWRVFTVREMPQDVPQAGVHWLPVELPTFRVPTFAEMSEHFQKQYKPVMRFEKGGENDAEEG